MSGVAHNGVLQKRGIIDIEAMADGDDGVSGEHKPVTSEPLRSKTGKNALKYKRLKLRSCGWSTCECTPIRLSSKPPVPHHVVSVASTTLA